jgi:hypothetical protein
MTPTEARAYALLLAKMVELVGTHPKLRFGRALDVACGELAMDPPEHIRRELLTRAFQVMSTGRIPGCPDA